MPQQQLIHQSIVSALDSVVDRLNLTQSNKIFAILLGTSDGIGLSRAFGSHAKGNSSGGMSEEILFSIETTWATLPSDASQGAGHYLRPIGLGGVKTVTAFYDNVILIHVHFSPLVSEVVGRIGRSKFCGFIKTLWLLSPSNIWFVQRTCRWSLLFASHQQTLEQFEPLFQFCRKFWTPCVVHSRQVYNHKVRLVQVMVTTDRLRRHEWYQVARSALQQKLIQFLFSSVPELDWPCLYNQSCTLRYSCKYLAWSWMD